MLIYKVCCQFGHSFPTMLESFAFGVGTRCAYELYVRITCLDGLDKRFQTLEVKILPLFVSHCKILHVERCRVTVLHRTYRVFPLVTVLKCFAFDNTSARESQHSGVNIGKSLAEARRIPFSRFLKVFTGKRLMCSSARVSFLMYRRGFST